jgi:hypothetical protein
VAPWIQEARHHPLNPTAEVDGARACLVLLCLSCDILQLDTEQGTAPAPAAVLYSVQQQQLCAWTCACVRTDRCYAQPLQLRVLAVHQQLLHAF